MPAKNSSKCHSTGEDLFPTESGQKKERSERSSGHTDHGSLTSKASNATLTTKRSREYQEERGVEAALHPSLLSQVQVSTKTL